jgi:hypothetical protein
MRRRQFLRSAGNALALAVLNRAANAAPSAVDGAGLSFIPA